MASVPLKPHRNIPTQIYYIFLKIYILPKDILYLPISNGDNGDSKRRYHLIAQVIKMPFYDNPTTSGIFFVPPPALAS
jgi:hypothetical protein